MYEHKLWIDGKWGAGVETKTILSPFSETAVGKAHYASSDQMHQALAAAARAKTPFRRTSRGLRSTLLAKMAALLKERHGEFLSLLIDQAGKPRTAANVEFNRAFQTLTIAAEEAKRLGGDVIPLDIENSSAAYAPAISYWTPRGVVLGITPFNFPLNLVVHKIAPALAVGAPIVIKPAHQAPGPAHLLAALFEKAAQDVNAQAPAGESIPLSAVQIVSCSNEVAAVAVKSEIISTVSFTGSTKVGWYLQKEAVGKRVLLELGGNAGVIVHGDIGEAGLTRAAMRVAQGGFGYAGQSCISVQRVYVENKVFDAFTKRLVAEVKKLGVGDPAGDVTVGPLIDSGAAERVLSWINDAQKAGARVLVGGKRHSSAPSVVEPTVLTGVDPALPIVCEEVFGPVVVVEPYDLFIDAVRAINDSKFGLQAGVFTDNSKLSELAVDELEVGGVTINEVPTFRADQMPYGGVKQSGLGREGVRYAMEEYCERKTVVTWRGERDRLLDSKTANPQS